jgi:hypothetical protein
VLRSNVLSLTWSIFSLSGASGGARGSCWSLSIMAMSALSRCLGIIANGQRVAASCSDVTLGLLSDKIRIC